MATPKVKVGKRTIRRSNGENKVMWAVSRRENGKRVRTFHDSRSAAMAEADRIREQFNAAGATWINLPAHEKNKLIQIYHDAVAHKLDLAALVAAAKNAPKQTGPTVREAIDELLKHKGEAKLAEGYVNNLRIVLDDFARGIEHRSIASIDTPDVKEFLSRKNVSYRATLRSRLSILFLFAVRNGWRDSNPCVRLQRVKVATKSPPIFTVEQFQKALVWFRSHRRGFAWFVLTTCCGLRPDEALNTSRRDINFDEGWVRVEAQSSRMQQRRVVYPRPEAMRLLKSALRGSDLPLDIQPKKRIQHRLRSILGIPAWPKDITRHTAASYWVAAEPNLGMLAEQLGNSERVLKKHYRAVVTREQASEFWRVVSA